MEEIRIIKKYRNRRLYDPTISQYITIEVIKKLIMQNINFQIIDVKTKENVTNQVLLQIINEQQNSQRPIFTEAVLKKIILFYETTANTIFGEYLEKAVDSFFEQQMIMQKHFKDVTTPLSVDNIIGLSQNNLLIWQKCLEKILISSLGKQNNLKKNKK